MATPETGMEITAAMVKKLRDLTGAGMMECKAALTEANGDMEELERHLSETRGARLRLIATDGVFSMDGFIARIDRICDLAERYDALVMIDDSHASGFVGPTGRD